MTDDLSRLSAADIDGLPFGYIALAPDGTIRKYNRYEADLAGKDPEEVLGKNFFKEVAPCTQVREFEGRFEQFVAGEVDEPTLTFDFEFKFRHGQQRVRIGFVRSPLDKEVILTVNRVQSLDLPVSAELRHDPRRGTLSDPAGQPVVTAGADFWRALDSLYRGRPEADRTAALHLFGREWGMQHALRVESWVQKEHGNTLREVELQVALQALAGSMGVLGLGRFEVDLRYRRRGLLLVRHHNSPFVTILAERDGAACPLLAGFHAGLISYLSGRTVSGREVQCSRYPEAPCRFVVGTDRRLERLFDPAEGSSDADLLIALGARPKLDSRGEEAPAGEGGDE